MKKLLIVFVLIPIFSLGQNSLWNKYDDVTTTSEDKKYYKLTKELSEWKKSTPSIKTYKLFIPWDFRYLSNNSPETLFHIEGRGYFKGYIFRLESYNDSKVSKYTSQEFVKLTEEGYSGDRNNIIQMMNKKNPNTYNDLKLIDIDFNLIIDSKHFIRRVTSYYYDKFKNTEYEYRRVYEYMYTTIHNGKRYTLILSYIGNDKSIERLNSFFNAIAGTLEIDKKKYY
jgi:hypothetical protein